MVIAMGMREIDARVFAQQGMCTVHADASDFSDVDFRGKGLLSATGVALRRYWLRALGVHKAALFPDLGALAEELKGRRYTTGT
jgi:hypothetical protein